MHICRQRVCLARQPNLTGHIPQHALQQTCATVPQLQASMHGCQNQTSTQHKNTMKGLLPFHSKLSQDVLQVKPVKSGAGDSMAGQVCCSPSVCR